MGKVRMMNLEECRFPGIELVRFRKNVSQGQVAKWVTGEMDKDWYQRFQRGRNQEARFGDVLLICANLKMNLDSAINHMSKAAPIADRDLKRYDLVVQYNQMKADPRMEVLAEKMRDYLAGRRVTWKSEDSQS